MLPLLLAASVAAAAPCHNVTFNTAPWFEGGGLIRSIAAADFNGDGLTDLVVASGGTTGMTGRAPGLKVFLNEGNGRFGDAITVSSTLYVSDVKTFDFDGDGAPDIVATDEDTGKLIVFANRRTSFPEVWRDDEGGSAPALGDFDGDGRIDLVHRVGAELVVLKGGNAAFTKVRFTEPAAVSGAILAADLDRDGRADVIEMAPAENRFYIRRGSAATVLGAATPTAMFRETPWLAFVGDFDGSGYPDIVSLPRTTAAMEVLHDPAVSSAAPVWQPWSYLGPAAAIDVNGDGVTDLVFEVPFGRIVPAVLGANATFQALPYAFFPLPDTSLDSIVAGDFDGDGKPDVAMANTHAVSVLLNRGGGRFAAPPELGVPRVLRARDLNHDGIPDLITAGNPIVWFGNADGTYRPGTAARPAAGNLMEVADLNGDGNDDLVVVATNPTGGIAGQLWILLGDGSGSFTTKDLGAFAYRPTSLSVVDVDGDGKLDIVAGNSFTGGPPHAVTIAWGRGDGTFEPPVDLDSAAFYLGPHMTAGDINGDGLPDIVAGDAYGRSTFLNLGGRKFQTTSTREPIDGQIRLADMNGDGKADLVEAVSRLFTVGIANGVDVTVRLGRSDGTFSSGITTQAPVYDVRTLDVVDFNGDGKRDVLINDYGTTASTNTFTVLLGRGTGEFAPPMLFPSTGDLSVVDVNGDGRPDIMNGDAVRLNRCEDKRRATTH